MQDTPNASSEIQQLLQSIDAKRRERYMHFSDALKLLNVSVEAFVQMINDGQLQSAYLPDGEIYISQRSVEALLPKEQTALYQETAALKGKEISIREAARKYHLQASTLTRWMQRGYIHRLGKDGQRTLIDEGDVAYCARVYQDRAGPGRWVFDEHGKPYPQ